MTEGASKFNEYSRSDAGLYATLGINGTTYEFGFRPAERLLGRLTGMTALDFGSGGGRSSHFLRGLGAKRVIGVDHNAEMVAVAERVEHEGIEYHHVGATIPLENASVDVAFSSCAFIEMNNPEPLMAACREIARVLKPAGVFVLLSGNPESFSCRYASFAYGHPPPFEPGKAYRCEINVGGKAVHVYDTFWSEDEYRRMLERVGLRVETAIYPKAEKAAAWHIDEGRVAPFMLLKAIKHA